MRVSPSFIAAWVSFSISEEPPLQSNINIRCDQSARNSKQTAETCLGCFLFKTPQCKSTREPRCCRFNLLSHRDFSVRISSHLSQSFCNSTQQANGGRHRAWRDAACGIAFRTKEEGLGFVCYRFLSNHSPRGKQTAMVRFYEIKYANTILQTTKAHYLTLSASLSERNQKAVRFALLFQRNNKELSQRSYQLKFILTHKITNPTQGFIHYLMQI